MVGFVKIWRKCTENNFYFSERFTYWQAFMDLIILATYKKRTVKIRGINVVLKPGDLCYSQLSLAARWKWTDKTVKKFLNVLENEQMIRYKASHVTTIIRIVNWNKYNNNPSQVSEQMILQNPEQTPVQTPNNLRTNKEDNKKEKNNNSDLKKNVNNIVNNFSISQDEDVSDSGDGEELNIGDILEGDIDL